MGLEPIAYVHVMYMYYGRENKTEKILDIPKPHGIRAGLPNVSGDHGGDAVVRAEKLKR